MVWGNSLVVVEGGQSGLKVRLLHPTLWECVLLVHVMFGSEWVAREDKFDHGLDLALSFLILSHLMFNIITDLGQFLFLLFFVRFDQSNHAFSTVLLRSITLLLQLWLDQRWIYRYSMSRKLMLALSLRYRSLIKDFSVTNWFPMRMVRILNVNGWAWLLSFLTISTGRDFIKCVFGNFENRKSPVCLISMFLKDRYIELSYFLAKVSCFIVRHELMLIQLMFISSHHTGFNWSLIVTRKHFIYCLA